MLSEGDMLHLSCVDRSTRIFKAPEGENVWATRAAEREERREQMQRRDEIRVLGSLREGQQLDFKKMNEGEVQRMLDKRGEQIQMESSAELDRAWQAEAATSRPADRLRGSYTPYLVRRKTPLCEPRGSAMMELREKRAQELGLLPQQATDKPSADVVFIDDYAVS
ncbi:hypothetical protein PHYPSEUDO_005079 [Phytophthora pseudosyringae]|uniref:Uncharacterized protein n=1 Tax=Phytophthora pseudosyringae TaxID=221518 RepID=A0A8T1VMC6_9STRA|nr:hypothetical protein PHYPSEUDO_005079 [Phytophthora pseudosyringae]